MKIAIDVRPLVSGDAVRGIGVYTRELIGELQKRKDITISTVHGSQFTGHFDIVHFTSFNPFIVSIPLVKSGGTKFVLTIYDLIPLIYPDHYPSGIKGGIRWAINKYLIKKNVDAIITISETSKKDICRLLGVDPKKVFVTHLASRSVFKKVANTSLLYSIEVKYKLPKRFAFYVGDINYNKNIPNLIEACKLAKIPLVIAGKQAIQIDKENLDHAELRHLKDVDWNGVIRLGFVEDADLVGIYNLATVFIQPSLYEGFGLPAVEAVACGVPVAVARSQCMVEVLGDDFSYCGPADAKSMAKAILNPNRNKKFPRNYSWSKTAEETWEVYKYV